MIALALQSPELAQAAESAAATAAALSPSEPTGLSTGGWAFMGLALAMVLALTVFCFHRVLTTKPPHETEVPPGLGP